MVNKRKPFVFMVEVLKVKVTQSYLALWQEYWSGLPYPLGIIPTQGLNPGSALEADSLPSEPRGKPRWFSDL